MSEPRYLSIQQIDAFRLKVTGIQDAGEMIVVFMKDAEQNYDLTFLVDSNTGEVDMDHGILMVDDCAFYSLDDPTKPVDNRLVDAALADAVNRTEWDVEMERFL